MSLIGVKLDISMLPVTLNFLPRTVFLFYSGASSVEFGFNKKRNGEFSKTTKRGHKPALPHRPYRVISSVFQGKDRHIDRKSEGLWGF